MRSSQDAGAQYPVACAMSPTSVMEPDSERRPTIRSSMGERSCTSSTTMCPYDRLLGARSENAAGRAASSPRPARQCRPRPRHLLDRGAPGSVQEVELGRAQDAPLPASSMRGLAPNRSCRKALGRQPGPDAFEHLGHLGPPAQLGAEVGRLRFHWRPARARSQSPPRAAVSPLLQLLGQVFPQQPLDQPPAGVVGAGPPLGGPDDVSRGLMA